MAESRVFRSARTGGSRARGERDDVPGRKRLESHYKAGERDGQWTPRHDNGKRAGDQHDKDGKMDGLWTWHHGNETAALTARYKDGVEVKD